MTKLRSDFIVPILIIGLLFAGCMPGSTLPSSTIAPTPTNAFEPTLPTVELVTATATSSELTPVMATANTPAAVRPQLQLTFVSDRSGQSGIYALEVNCLEAKEPCLGEPQLLFEWDKRISAVDWSPNGDRIVFESEGKLFVADWNGENAIQLVSTPGSATWPQWSPDGMKIAFIFAALRPGTEILEPYQIQIYDLNTNQATPILPKVVDPRRIYWLPSGEMAYIAKVSEMDRTELISIVHSDGSVLQQLPENATDYTHLLGLAFSPEGKQLAFVGETNPGSGKTTVDIYATDRDGKQVANLTNGSGHSFGPVWSPFEGWIAFASNRSGDYDIYMVKPDGTNLLRLTQTPSRDIDPAWRVLR